MANTATKITVEEIVTRKGTQIIAVEYKYTEVHPGGGHEKCRISLKRDEYEKFMAEKRKFSFPFDAFVKILKPLMMGEYAEDDIPEAFNLLDADHSGTIDIDELAQFMPIIVPRSSPQMLLHYIQKVDQNGDHKLNIREFTAFIKQGVGRDIAIGHI